MKSYTLLLALGLVACGGSKPAPDPTPVDPSQVDPVVDPSAIEEPNIGGDIMAPVLLDATSAAQPVDAKVKQHIVIRLPGNPSTGFMWHVDNQTPEILEQVGDIGFESDPAEPEMVGVGGTFVVQFEAIGAGAGSAVLKYARSWEDVEPEQQIQLNVTVVE